MLFVEFHEVSFDESIEVAVHDGIDVGCLVVGTVVLDTAVVKDIGAEVTERILAVLRLVARFMFSITISSG